MKSNTDNPEIFFATHNCFEAEFEENMGFLRLENRVKRLLVWIWEPEKVEGEAEASQSSLLAGRVACSALVLPKTNIFSTKQEAVPKSRFPVWISVQSWREWPKNYFRYPSFYVLKCPSIQIALFSCEDWTTEFFPAKLSLTKFEPNFIILWKLLYKIWVIQLRMNDIII